MKNEKTKTKYKEKIQSNKIQIWKKTRKIRKIAHRSKIKKTKQNESLNGFGSRIPSWTEMIVMPLAFIRDILLYTGKRIHTHTHTQMNFLRIKNKNFV